MTQAELADLEYYRTKPCVFLSDAELNDYINLLDKQVAELEVKFRFSPCSQVGA